MYRHKEGATFENDNKFGLSEEDLVLPILEEFFREKFIKSENEFCIYDSYNTDKQIEIKSRRNKYSDFSTTLIGVNKAINTNKAQLFIFNFSDSIYYIQYEEDKFKSWIKPFQRDSRKDFEDKAKDYFYIPIEELILIKKKDLPDSYTLPKRGICLIKLKT
tara:strand:+ start:439 stop:921 length:483 start_codon:yes stop_codon:yes gene_type:complete